MTWTARNTGLTGTELNVKYIHQDPATRHLPSTGHVLYIATNGGCFKSINGGRTWTKLPLPDPSNAEFADSPAATVDELTFHWIVSISSTTIMILAAKNSVERVWLYRSTDSGATWISRGVTTV